MVPNPMLVKLEKDMPVPVVKRPGYLPKYIVCSILDATVHCALGLQICLNSHTDIFCFFIGGQRLSTNFVFVASAISTAHVRYFAHRRGIVLTYCTNFVSACKMLMVGVRIRSGLDFFWPDPSNFHRIRILP
jgi:hypothetical protein